MTIYVYFKVFYRHRCIFVGESSHNTCLLIPLRKINMLNNSTSDHAVYTYSTVFIRFLSIPVMDLFYVMVFFFFVVVVVVVVFFFFFFFFSFRVIIWSCQSTEALLLTGKVLVNRSAGLSLPRNSVNG